MDTSTDTSHPTPPLSFSSDSKPAGLTKPTESSSHNLDHDKHDLTQDKKNLLPDNAPLGQVCIYNSVFALSFSLRSTFPTLKPITLFAIYRLRDNFRAYRWLFLTTWRTWHLKRGQRDSGLLSFGI